MGNENSNLIDSNLRSQRDEDISFNSCSTNKPIGAESSFRSSPKVPLRNKSTAKGSSVNTKIIVVADGCLNEENEDNKLIKKLDNIPIVQPFIPLSLSLTNKLHPETKIYRLNGKLWTDLFLKYQDNLKQCSDVVSFDQNTLNSRIKEVDLNLQTQYLALIEKRNKFAKYTEQVQKVQEISTALTRIHSTLKNTIHIMNKLNSMLPVGDQIETFTLGYNPTLSTNTGIASTYAANSTTTNSDINLN